MQIQAINNNYINSSSYKPLRVINFKANETVAKDTYQKDNKEPLTTKEKILGWSVIILALAIFIFGFDRR